MTGGVGELLPEISCIPAHLRSNNTKGSKKESVLTGLEGGKFRGRGTPIILYFPNGGGVYGSEKGTYAASWEVGFDSD